MEYVYGGQEICEAPNPAQAKKFWNLQANAPCGKVQHVATLPSVSYRTKNLFMDDAISQDSADVHLISATLAGDDKAFAQLITKHKRRVFSLAARFARDKDELDDICQDVFIKAYENLRSFRQDAPFEHWILRIATRKCHDTLRARRRDNLHGSLDDYAYELRDRAEESREQARQAREQLRWSMAKLKPDEQMVITLLELEELTVREVAGMTGWSETNVKVRAYRARKALKRVLGGA